MILLLTITYSISFALFSHRFSFILLIFFIFGLIYNVKPIRAKELPYIDVVVESANNPIRIAIGWYACAAPGFVLPLSAVMFFWCYGAFLMTGKRLAEKRFLGDNALPYRITFQYYSEFSLLMFMIFYSLSSVIFYLYMIFNVFSYHYYYLSGLFFLVMFYIWCFRLVKEHDSLLKDPESLLKKPVFFIFCIVGLIIVLTTFML